MDAAPSDLAVDGGVLADARPEDSAPPTDGALDLAADDAGPMHGEWPCWERRDPPPAAPTERIPVEDEAHGVPFEDPYRWLEESDERVQAHIDAQRSATDRSLGDLDESRAARLRALHRARQLIVPQVAGERRFFALTPEDQARPVIFVEEDGARRVLLDTNTWPEDASLGRWLASPSGEHLLFMESMNSMDAGFLFVLDVASGEVLEGGMMSPRLLFFAAEWDSAGEGFYYFEWMASLDEPGRQFYHVLGTSLGDDIDVSEASGLFGRVNEPAGANERFLQSGNRLYRQDLRRTLRTQERYELFVDPGTFSDQMVYQGDSRALYARQSSFFFEFGRVLDVAPGRPASQWRERVPHRADELLVDFVPVEDGTYTIHLVEGAMTLRFFDDAAALRAQATLPMGVISLLGADEEGVRVRFESPLRSPRVLRWHRDLDEPALIESAAVSVELDEEAFLVRTLSYESTPGEFVSRPVVRMPVYGPADGEPVPTLIEAYGGFSVPWLPRYSPRVALWLEEGGAYAVPQLRGGGEQGSRWWADGVGAGRQRTYDDLYAAAEALIDEGVADAGRIALQGASNGGLTMAVAITQRPELFAAAIIEAPVVDLMRYHLSGSGWAWVNEYGSANTAEDVAHLLALSPYHRSERNGCTSYPRTLVVTGDSDDRVVPMHSFKLAASLSQHTRFEPVYLHVAPRTGHAGSSYFDANLGTDLRATAFLDALR